MAALRYDGQNVAVLGLGATGRSLVRFLHARGARVSVHDESEPGTRDGLPDGVPLVRCDGARDRLSPEIDWVALSPGFPRARPIVRQALARGRPVLGDIEIFARHLPPEARVIAITGSNGKSTTTALTGELARLGDPNAQVAGNIGEPVLDALTRAPETRTWVLELSSFQLESTASLRPAAATVLNVSANHLDRYDSLFDYAAAKASIFRQAARKIVNRDCPWSSSMVAADAPAHRRFGLNAPEREDDYGLHEAAGETLLVQGDRSFCTERALYLAGRHQLANALAALALAEPIDTGWTADRRAAASAVLARFKGL
ncbi:MAG: UDP-N-acetylmuramoyl-L-alanine--D-glutamate ligase, partial [Casimicrobiaceae bacterium]